ncbi:MAG: response regulator [Clostridium sp.]|nr:response regulator [Clostridium sp.]
MVQTEYEGGQKRRGEKGQYFFTILFTLLALAGMVIYNFSTFYSNAVSDMLAVGESSLAQETEQLKGYLNKGMDVLQVTAITVEYMMQNGAGKEEIETFLVEESARYKQDIDPNFTGIYGVFNGDYIDGIGWVPDADYEPRERVWYLDAQAAGGAPTVVSPYVDAQTNTVMMSVSQMLYDHDSVISFDIVLDQIQLITQDVKLNDMGYGFVIDGQGMVVAHTDSSERGKNYLWDDEMNALLNRVYEKQGATFTARIYDEDCTIFTDTVMDDWYVVMLVSNTKLYASVRRMLVRNALVCIGVFAVIVYFCTLAFRRIRVHMRNEEESRRNVEKMNETILRTLARAIDAKDRYTNGHSQRVARYAAQIAKRMGKDEDYQEKIYQAGLLHDIGKIHVPDAIINKPARLTDEEFAYIKLHPVSGYYILRDIQGNDMIAQGAKGHHERYDGNGYPNGLTGSDIPEAARILGVADAYDAMTSNRSYRQVMPQEKVRAEIEKGIGLQFDPEAAKIMLQMMDEDTDYQMRHQEGERSNILIVDDEQESIEQVEAALKDEAGYVLYRETSGRAALALMKKTPMDLVLLDVQMPDMDGIAVYKQMKAQMSGKVPVIFLTSDKSIQTIEQLNALDAEGYLVKPFMPQVLLEILHSVLQEKDSGRA